MKNKRLVLLELRGGNDTMNTLVDYTNPKYYEGRPTLAYKKEETLVIDERYGLNRSLKNIKELYDDNSVAIVRGAGHDKTSFTHFRNALRWAHGVSINVTDEDGWLGRTFKENDLEDMECYSHVNQYLHTNPVGQAEGIDNKRFDNVPGTVDHGINLELLDTSHVKNKNILKVYNGNNDAHEVLNATSANLDPDLVTPYAKDQLGRGFDLVHRFIHGGSTIPVSKVFHTG